jgi:hypothetical protein
MIGCLLYLLLFVQLSVAHAPSDITLDFDNETNILRVTVLHPVGKVAEHFVDRIVVELNNEKLIEQKFIIQSSDGTQEACYIIPGIKIGDEIKVTGYCNISGKKIKTLTIYPSEPGEE